MKNHYESATQEKCLANTDTIFVQINHNLFQSTARSMKLFVIKKVQVIVKDMIKFPSVHLRFHQLGSANRMQPQNSNWRLRKLYFTQGSICSIQVLAFSVVVVKSIVIEFFNQKQAAWQAYNNSSYEQLPQRNVEAALSCLELLLSSSSAEPIICF